MKLSKKQGGDFVPHEEGTFKAVCVDVTPLVKTQSKFGERETFKLVFETDAPEREDGTRQCVWSRGFTPSLNEKANFRKFLRQWLGRDLTPAEETEFDTEVRKAELVKLPERQDRNPEGFEPSKQSDWMDAAKAFAGGMADSALQVPQGIYTQAGEMLDKQAVLGEALGGSSGG